MSGKEENRDDAVRQISFLRLVFEAIPEIYGFQLLTTVLLAGLYFLLGWLIDVVAEAGGTAVTTANIRDFLLSWRAPVLLFLAFLLVSVFVVFEIFANIHMCDDILMGRRVIVRQEIGKAVGSMRKFLCPAGIATLLYIFLAVPLVGFGFSISLSRKFHIPSFIMDYIQSNPPIFAGYLAGILALMILGIRWIFSLHAVLIDGMKPGQGRKVSVQILKKNWRSFILSMLAAFLVIALLNAGIAILRDFPESILEEYGKSLPHNYYLDLSQLLDGKSTDQELGIIGYRSVCVFVVVGGGFLAYILAMFCSSYLMLRFTRCYHEYTGEKKALWPERPKKHRYLWKVLLLILSLIVLVLLSAGAGVEFSEIFNRKENVHIVAHRTGGNMAPENSLEGLELAIAAGCYGSETDTQRTADGYYIINHDNTFKRLTGVNKKPGEMTLEEVRGLTITERSTGKQCAVPTVEELLDAVKGREKLFLELKGVSADRRMADDLVTMIREKDCVEDIVLISLKYSVIDYIEKNYPEFETGVLMFGGIGNVSRMNCDILIMEEEMSTDQRINQIHSRGKQVYVWTVNTMDSMYRFLDSGCDGVITDRVEMAQRVQEELDKRSDFQIIHDRYEDFWED